MIILLLVIVLGIKERKRKEGEIRSIDLINGEHSAYLRLKKMSTCAL